MPTTSTDLQITITSSLSSAQQFLIYQDAQTITVKNYQLAAWDHQYIAPGSSYTVTLPLQIQVGASLIDPLRGGVMSTKLINAGYNGAYDVFNNNGALDICVSSNEAELNATNDNSITVYNNDIKTRHVLVCKNSKPLFAAEVRPEYKLSFAIDPKIYFALCDVELKGDFFDAATLTTVPTEIAYEGQSQLFITLSEDTATGKITIHYAFGA
jgi:hypothetical protein